MPPKRSRHQGNTEMPASLAKKLDRNAAAAESKGATDDGRFTKKFKINAKTRKDVRKQARNDKKQRKNESHRRAHGFAATPTPKSNPKQTKVKPVADSNTAKKQKPEVAKKPAGNTEEEERARLTRFAKRNEGMYQLLRDSNLIANVDEEAGVRSKADGTDDMEDREMRRLERNLGIKSNQKLAGAFFEEGLGDLFEGIEFGSKSVRTTKPEAATVATKTAVPAAKRAVADKQARQASPLVSEDEDSFGDDDDIEMASSSDSEEEDDDESDINDDDESEGESEDDENVKFGVAEDDDDDDDMFGLNDFGSDANDDGSDSEDSDIAEMYRSQGVDINPDLSAGSDMGSDADSDSEIGSDEDDIGSGGDLGSESDEDSASEAPAPSAKAVDVSATVSKYIPPSLRRKEAEAEDERIAAIRKALQGQLNRLSESNIEGIITQVEALYQKYPRHHVTDVLGDLILQAIRSRTHMLDSFLYVNAALVGAVYRAVGLEPIAHMVQKLMEEFEKYFSQGQADFIASKEKATSGEDEGGEFSTGKECQNLSVFIAELYNFQVISCQLVYDVIRMCITDINEFTAELLLKIIRISGVQLRRDDPLALKEIVHQVTDTVGKAGTGAFSVRCQFMVESLTHLKDNRMRNTMSQNAENVVRLKKFLGNMDKRRSVTSTEPINIGLQDIRDIGTKGKWWLVGASWIGNQHDGEQQNDSLAAREALRKMKEQTGDSEMDRLLRLAREQHMNTDIRRSIFVTLLSSEDYADAFERLLKLDLKKAQIREVVRVVMHCCGQEAAYNPYYTLVAFKLCCYHNTYRLTMQYALWDFLREMGETDVGGLGRIGQEDDNDISNVPLRRIVNLAKLYAWLVDKQVLSLMILKTVTFAKVGQQARIFFQVMFSTIFLQHKKQSSKDETALYEIFQKATANPTMCHGILFFFHHFVKNCELVTEEERPLMKWGCKVAKQVFRNAAGSDMRDETF